MKEINVVLYEPEIPQNTGNIMRTCVASNCKLHLIEPLGFKLDENSIRRSGMDYREHLKWNNYSDWNDFKEKNPGTYVFITRYGKKPPSTCDFNNVDNSDKIYLVFGKESTGVPKEILHKNLEHCYRLPMVENARSLNLSNCVAICVYEALRQLDYNDLCHHETIKGEDWLD